MKPIKFWAETREDAKKFLEYCVSMGAGDWVLEHEDYLSANALFFNDEYVTHQDSDRKYFDAQRREEFFFPTPVHQDEGGWFINDGKHEQPMADDVLVDVEFRAGNIKRGDRADTWWWKINNDDICDGDILAWRYHVEDVIAPLESEKGAQITDKPIISDGGSSSYYALTITNKAGQSIDCQMGDIIRCVYGDNFSLGNIAKACRRMYEASQGRGKQDVSIDYDARKISYFANEYSHWHKGK